MKNRKLFKLSLTAILAAASYVMSTFVVFPNMAPFQHFFNVITGVFLGPYYGFAAALLTGCLRIALNGRSALAIIGAVFGALLAGLLYRKTKSFVMAAVGELIGTGIIGAVVSYPVMTYLFNTKVAGIFFYVVPFSISSATGATMGVLILLVLKKTRTLAYLQGYLED